MKAIKSKKQAFASNGTVERLSFCVEEKRTRLDFGTGRTALNFIYTGDIQMMFWDTCVKTDCHISFVLELCYPSPLHVGDLSTYSYPIYPLIPYPVM